MFGWLSGSQINASDDNEDDKRVIDEERIYMSNEGECGPITVLSAVEVLNQHIARHFSDDAVKAIEELKQGCAIAQAVRTALPLFNIGNRVSSSSKPCAKCAKLESLLKNTEKLARALLVLIEINNKPLEEDMRIVSTQLCILSVRVSLETCLDQGHEADADGLFNAIKSWNSRCSVYMRDITGQLASKNILAAKFVWEAPRPAKVVDK